MTKLLSLLIGFTLLLPACAQQTQKLDSLERLDKLGKVNRLREQREESDRLQRLVAAERQDRLKRRAQQYPIPKPASDESIYALLLKSYRESDLDGVDFYCEHLRKNFAKSIFTDNAIYFRGQLSLSYMRPADALRDFEEILKTYPTSNKRAAALLGKGVAYRKLQLFPYAEKALGQLKKEYPGSPEFFKAELEEQILKAERN